MTASDLLVFLISVLATARLYRLFVTDDITVVFRARLDRLYYRVAGEGSGRWGCFWDTVREGATCPWCLWFWAGGAVLWTGLVWGGTLVWQVPMMALAANYIQANLNVHLGDKE